jgi:hypothetical protein
VRHSKEEALAAIKAGNFSFLFNDDGEFIADSFVPIPGQARQWP